MSGDLAMSDHVSNDDAAAQQAPEQDAVDREMLEAIGHPRGTLAILLIYAIAFAAGWLLLYFGTFMPRGVPQ